MFDHEIQAATEIAGLMIAKFPLDGRRGRLTLEVDGYSGLWWKRGRVPGDHALHVMKNRSPGD
jgi:hypothetical protein